VPSNTSNRIPKIRRPLTVDSGYQQTPMLVGPSVTDFHRRACKNEEFKSDKLFTVFKIVTRFLKIKEAFTINLELISVDYHFLLHQIPKNTKNILRLNKRNIRSVCNYLEK
jgi:hypothetical protein